ncbi:EcsC family protein [Cohnella fermenti]|uniref:EcsC family protein n=1 Tax=Cohnella fermenti TaxID=2565925 RepID=A0A4S4C4N0_9BACL|nr:EcsC family protein [Cohnella fermenti]
MVAITQQTITKALDWAYEKVVVGGVPGTQDAYELAAEFSKGKGELRDQINSIIRWQNTKSATSGFLTGLGGIVTLPVAIPANLASVLYIQLRMIAAIAIMGGHDVKDDKVRTMAYASLCGNAAKDILKDVGIVIGKKMAEQGLKKLSGEVIKKINQKVGFRLLTKFGSKGVVNLSKAIPLVGGVTGAVMDGVSTNIIGNTARNLFIE